MIRLIGNLNNNISGRTKKEYCEDNKDKIQEWRNNNKEKANENNKDYRQNNKEKNK